MSNTNDGTSRWVTADADDSQPGDLIRIASKPPRRVSSRDNPPYWVPVLKLVFSDVTMTIGKLHPIDIWDPDGSVLQRVNSSGTAAPTSGNSGTGGAFIMGQLKEPGLARGIAIKQRP